MGESFRSYFSHYAKNSFCEFVTGKLIFHFNLKNIGNGAHISLHIFLSILDICQAFKKKIVRGN